MQAIEAYLGRMVSVKNLHDKKLLEEGEDEVMAEEALAVMEAMHKKHLVGRGAWREEERDDCVLVEDGDAGWASTAPHRDAGGASAAPHRDAGGASAPSHRRPRADMKQVVLDLFGCHTLRGKFAGSTWLEKPDEKAALPDLQCRGVAHGCVRTFGRSNGGAGGKAHHEKCCEAAQKHAAETRGRQLERAADTSRPPASSVAPARQEKKKAKRRRESSSAGGENGRRGSDQRRSYTIPEKHKINVEGQIAIDENKRVDDMKAKIWSAIRAVAVRYSIPETSVRHWWKIKEEIKLGAVNPQPSTVNPAPHALNPKPRTAHPGQ